VTYLLISFECDFCCRFWHRFSCIMYSFLSNTHCSKVQGWL